MALAPRRVALPALIAAIALLNASLSFHNIWPTPAIAWTGELSVEFAAVVLLLVLIRQLRGAVPRAIVRVAAVLWILLCVGHYADVTTPALYGRDINLYWDLRYMPDVARMVAAAAPLWLMAAIVIGAVAALSLLYVVFRWALACVVAGLDSRRVRLTLSAIAAAAIVLFVAQHASEAVPPLPPFATPVTQTYERQVKLVAGAMSASATLPPSPSFDADLSLVRGADVFLVFVEGYGAVAYERPDIAPLLTAPRSQLETAIRDTGRRVVSAFVDSPTFGGSSWLAHISLMSGIEVRDPETNARLMTEQRDTIVTSFARAGYRTLALMPGLRQRWPEGSFYRFDDTYGAARLDYRGPEFGWFAIPGSIHPRPHRYARGGSSLAPESVRVLSDHLDALPVQPDTTVPAGVGPDVRRASLRRPVHCARLCKAARLDAFCAGLRRCRVLHLRDARRLSAQTAGPRHRAHRHRRPSAGCCGERRRRVVERSRACRRQPRRDPRFDCWRAVFIPVWYPRGQRSATCTHCCRFFSTPSIGSTPLPPVWQGADARRTCSELNERHRCAGHIRRDRGHNLCCKPAR